MYDEKRLFGGKAELVVGLVHNQQSLIGRLIPPPESRTVVGTPGEPDLPMP